MSNCMRTEGTTRIICDSNVTHLVTQMSFALSPLLNLSCVKLYLQATADDRTDGSSNGRPPYIFANLIYSHLT